MDNNSLVGWAGGMMIYSAANWIIYPELLSFAESLQFGALMGISKVAFTHLHATISPNTCTKMADFRHLEMALLSSSILMSSISRTHRDPFAIGASYVPFMAVLYAIGFIEQLRRQVALR